MSRWPRGQKLYEHGLLIAHRTTSVDGQPAELWELSETFRTNDSLRELFVDAAALVRARHCELFPRLYELDATACVVTSPPWVSLAAVGKVAGRLPPSIVVTVAYELARKLAEHTDLLLRSLAPHTVAITTAGGVRLLDLTIARYQGRAGRPTEAGVLKGEIAYMSPEAALGRHLDPRADVFSLGSVAFQLLTGRKPFIGASEMETLMRVRSAVIEGIDEVGRLHGAAIQGLIQRLTLRPRDERGGWRELALLIERDFASVLVGPEALADEVRGLAPAAVDEAVLYAY